MIGMGSDIIPEPSQQPEVQPASNTRVSIGRIEAYWKKLGPGLTTGAADDDPGGIATYSQTGAQTGPQFLWLSVFTFPLMATVQEMCARIGLTTGRGLAANIRLHYPRRVLYFCAMLLFAANVFNLGVNLGAMAKAVQLLAPQIPFLVLVLGFTILSLLLQVFTSYKTYARYLKYLALVLFAYVISAFLARPDWPELLSHTFVPSLSLSKDMIFLVTAILGTTISPYLFFWQTSQEVEEEILQGKTTVHQRQHVSDQEIKDMRVDVWSGMFVSNLVMFFIIASAASTLFANGITNITTATDAAEALRPLAGDSAALLFTIGIIGTGLLSVPVLAGSASYAIAESFHWKEGLYRKAKAARAFYGIIFLAMLLGFIINATGIDPIRALIYSAVANGLVAPIVLFFIVRLSGSKKVMGKRANKPLASFIGWATVTLMAIAAAATLISLFF